MRFWSAVDEADGFSSCRSSTEWKTDSEMIECLNQLADNSAIKFSDLLVAAEGKTNDPSFPLAG
jgi:hypothetical protein